MQRVQLREIPRREIGTPEKWSWRPMQPQLSGHFLAPTGPCFLCRPMASMPMSVARF